jgi:hypothetical protein
MYSGTTFRTKSGRVIGVHQKIDRIVYRHLKDRLPKRQFFPSLHNILHFEGTNGPDGIKRKSPAKDEPWHYIDPKDPGDTAIVEMINDHIYNMAVALKAKDEQRAAFEAAWMAHAIVDGLTPAHHYPLDEKIEELWGKPKEERLTVFDKNVIRGNSRRDTLSKNWEYWGARGVFTNHFMFEWGVATTIAPIRFDDAAPTAEMYKRIKTEKYDNTFMETLQRVATMEMYDEFSKLGWTRHLARETRDKLLPEIIQAVTLGWYKAVVLSEELS